MDRYEYRLQREQLRAARRRSRSGAGGVFLGGLIVAVGLLLLLDNMRIIHMRDIWMYWPLILVVFGLSRMVECHTPSSLIWGLLVTLLGGLILLDNLNVVPLDFNYIWPLIIIAFGLKLLWKALDRRRHLEDGSVSGDPSSSIMAVFSGGKRKIVSQDFKGLDVLALFGGVDLDLREAKIAGEQAVIDVNATFGGVEIKIPETWSLIVKTVAIFGGVEDKTIPPKLDSNAPAPRLVLTGTALFGGVSVRS